MTIKNITYVDIDKLEVDKCNIRQGIWDADTELINSIKQQGILEPLIVRPLWGTNDDTTYGIVCGSRRYNAAVEADIKEVPCIIKELDDREARDLSMIENRQRKDTPRWMDIEWVGLNYKDYISEGYTHNEAIDKLESTGFSYPTRERYVRIFQLPTEIKGLLREPPDRTTYQKEYIMRVTPKIINNTLSLGNADALTRIMDKYDTEKLMEIAIFFISIKEEIADKITNELVLHPEKSVKEIYRDISKKEYGVKEKIIKFDWEIWKAIEDICMDKQLHVDKFLTNTIRKRLVKEGYLKSEKLVIDEVIERSDKENKIEVRVTKSRLQKFGYKVIKQKGDIIILRCPTKDGHGCFFRAYNSGRISTITIENPSSYENPRERLTEEKNRLERKR
ncbi:MAG: ParB/RepB/Spo0J family partition protein [Deltaproteobacteria bacterium]|nr:ParB/RepB/Spo0J family partition protein [Deltaproteobacteria bacterium]